jgi:hypothetical protein
MNVDADNAVGRGRRWLGGGLVALTFASIVAFYAWTVHSSAADFRFGGQKKDYYNLLVDGFQEGHLGMAATPDPELLKLPPAERPGKAPFLLDASLYRDRYYLYFGVTPVVVLFWPFAALTGHDLPVAVAAGLFALAALLLSFAWWREMRRRFFPRLGRGWDALALAALGIGTIMPSTLRRPLFYEVAITAGWTFGALMLWALARAVRSPRPARWLVLAGAAAGLAIGARANLAPVALLALTVGAALVAREQQAGWRRAAACIAWAAAGAMPIGAGLAGYNYARFGHILEFGHSYQLGLNPQRMFRVTNLVHNVPLYYFAPPQFSPYFPFVAPAEEPPKPVDYIGREHVHGEFVWTLVVGLTLAGVAVTRSWRPAARFGAAALPVAVWFAGNLVVTCLTGVRANRYMLDFHPALVWATLGVLGIVLAERRAFRRLLAALAAAAVAGAVAFNGFASLQVHGFLAGTDPLTYQALARGFDGVVARVAPGLFHAVGDCVIELRWPAAGTGGRYPLISAGPTGFDDGVWVDFDGGGRARFVYQHWEYGSANGAWFTIEQGAAATVRVSGAFLLPPVHHAWYGDRSADERAALKRRLRLAVNGEWRFDRDVPSHDAPPHTVRPGRWRIGRDTDALFPGVIERVSSRPPDESWIAPLVARQGTLRMEITLLQDRFGLAEPLVQSGAFPRCDLISVKYVRPGFVQVVHDRFSWGVEASEEFAVDYGAPQHVEVDLPFARDPLDWTEDGRAAQAAAAPGRVRWNGREVLVLNQGAHPSGRGEIVLGANLVGASGARRSFAGELHEVRGLQSLHTGAAGFLDPPALSAADFRATRGTLVAWRRDDGSSSAIVWRRDAPDGPVRLGWVDEDRVSWSEESVAPDAAAFHIELPQAERSGDAGGRGLLEVEQGGRLVLTALTDFFTAPPAEAWGVEGGWSGTALRTGPTQPAPPALPGRVRLRFAVPAGGFAGAQPLLMTGQAGAADSLYLRPLGGERYVLGVDHWGYGGGESGPFELTAGVHTLIIEMANLLPERRDRGVRVWLDDRLVLAQPQQALYPAAPAEVFIARNPLGMSTSGQKFEGTLYSVRTGVPAPP